MYLITILKVLCPRAFKCGLNKFAVSPLKIIKSLNNQGGQVWEMGLLQKKGTEKILYSLLSKKSCVNKRISFI